MNLSKQNYVDVDPLDPKRMIVQGEDVFPQLDMRIYSAHTVSKDCPDLRKFDEALEKYYEWYPVLRLNAERRADTRFYFKEGTLRPIDFAQDVKNNEVIRTKEQFHDVLSQTHTSFLYDKYVYGPRMYKVDIPAKDGDMFINESTGYVIVVPAYHLTTDGKSHKNIRNFFNGYFKDRDHKPRIAAPQEVVNNANVLIPKDVEPRQVKPQVGGPFQIIGYEKARKVPSNQRGLSIQVRKLPSKAFMHPKGCSLTYTMVSCHVFLYNSLLLDYFNDLDVVASYTNTPYTIDRKIFKDVVEGHFEDLNGNDIGQVRTYQQSRREAPKTLYQTLETTRMHHSEYRKDMLQALINERFGPFLPVDFDPTGARSNNVVTNIGDIKMLPGPVNGTTGWSFPRHQIGNVIMAMTGQGDGTTLFSAVAHRTSYSGRFLRLYQDCVLRLSQLSAKGDVTRDELVAWPEYQELVALLPR